MVSDGISCSKFPEKKMDLPIYESRTQMLQEQVIVYLKKGLLRGW